MDYRKLCNAQTDMSLIALNIYIYIYIYIASNDKSNLCFSFMFVGIGSPSRYVGLWVVPEDEQRPKYGQRDC